MIFEPKIIKNNKQNKHIFCTAKVQFQNIKTHKSLIILIFDLQSISKVKMLVQLQKTNHQHLWKLILKNANKNHLSANGARFVRFF
jgi:hypothetical protein